ncbi:MAG: TolC family protein [Candidatus Omnitrophica bacterium]|nr:TolC family protein [Candidatus Omnitrophota bacterium]
MRRLYSILTTCFFLVTTYFYPAYGEGVVRIYGVHVKRVDSGVQLIIPSSHPLEFIDFKLENPQRLVIDLIGDNIYTDLDRRAIPVNIAGVKEVIPSFYANGIPSAGSKIDQLTVIFDGNPQYTVNSSTYQIVVDVTASSQLTKKLAKNEPYHKPYQNLTCSISDSYRSTSSGNTCQSGPLPQQKQTPEAYPRKSMASELPSYRLPQAPQGMVSPKRPPEAYRQHTRPPEPPKAPYMPSHANRPSAVKRAQIPQTTEDLAGRTLTLEECITIGLENHAPCRIALKEVELAQLKVDQAKRAKYPTATLKWQESVSEVSGGMVDSLGTRYMFEFQQPLYRGGEIRNSYRQSVVNVEVAAAKYEKIKQDLTFEVEKAFYTLAGSVKKEDLYEELVDESARISEIVEKRYEAGLSRRLELLTTQSMVNQLEFKREQNKNELTLAQLTLQNNLNIKGDEALIAIDPTPVEDEIEIGKTVDECLELARNNRPDLAINELLLKFNAYGIRIAKSRGRPQVSLSGLAGWGAEAYETEPKEFTEEWFVGLEVKYPWSKHTFKDSMLAQDRVPQAGQTDSTVFQTNTLEMSLYDPEAMKIDSDKKAAVIEYDKALEQLNKTELTINFEVKDSYFKYKKSLLTLKDEKNKLELSKEQVKVNQAMTELNEVAITELLKAELELADNNASYYQALADHHTAISELNKVVGITGYFDRGEK